jgi:hypothetical protein
MMPTTLLISKTSLNPGIGLQSIPQDKLDHFTEVLCNQGSPDSIAPLGGAGAESWLDTGPNPSFGVGSLSPTM